MGLDSDRSAYVHFACVQIDAAIEFALLIEKYPGIVPYPGPGSHQWIAKLALIVRQET
jgi:hypothetical protein